MFYVHLHDVYRNQKLNGSVYHGVKLLITSAAVTRTVAAVETPVVMKQRILCFGQPFYFLMYVTLTSLWRK
jgi:hypothetical protein